MTLAASGTHVLVVEDEAHMRRFLRTMLRHNGYDSVEAPTARAALDTLAAGGIGVVLLDLGLPDMDGVELTARIRESDDVPIVVVSGRDAEGTKIDALDRGANDYVTKPFRVGELMARVRAALRIAPGARRAPAPVFSVGDLCVDLGSRVVKLRGVDVSLTPTEYRLLHALVRRPGRVITHGELLREIWGSESAADVQHLRVYVRQLRHKLEANPAEPRYVLTVSRLGYRLCSETELSAWRGNADG